MLERFISVYPLVPAPGNPQSLNRYAYTLNNPLRYTDPAHVHAATQAGANTYDGDGNRVQPTVNG